MAVKKANEIKKICVIGGGTMGSAIAQHFIMKKMDVLLMDLSADVLEKGKQRIEQSLEEAVQRRIIKPEQKEQMLKGLRTSVDYADLADRDLVVEAVFEDFHVKKKVFAMAEEHADPSCILATNTSSYSITKLGMELKNPWRFLGIHYFFHAAKNKLIEVIPGAGTDFKVVSEVFNLYYLLDKVPIMVRDVPGFAVNRYFVPWLNEAAQLLEDGKGSIKKIDEIAMKTFGLGMGPFGLMNATGIPIAQHAAETLENHFGKYYKPCQKLKEQVEANQDWDLESDEPKDTDETAIQERLLAVAFGVAAQLVDEEVSDPTDVDLGARIGLRWPKGPFEMMNEMGFEKAREMVDSVFADWGMPLPRLLKKTDAEKGIPVEHIRSYVIQSTGIIEFYRPDAMNALNPDVVNQLAVCFEKLDSSDFVSRIILVGRGKAFVAGADIKFFVDNLNKNDFQAIYDFTKFGQDLLKKIAESSKTTIAYLDGLTLGGGLELALACDFRLATKQTFMAFPETGIGIYPGLGGTQRTPRLIGKGAAKYLVATGSMIGAEKALALGLVEQIVEKVVGLEELSKLQTPQKGQSTSDSVEEAFEGFDGVIKDELFENEPYKSLEKLLRKKAPLALKTAMHLIDEGEGLTLNQALDLELEALKEIFSSQDAKIGLESLIKRTKPVYTGK